MATKDAGAWVLSSGGPWKRRGRADWAPSAVSNTMVFGMYNACSVTDSANDGQYRDGQTAANWNQVRNAHMDPARVKVSRTFNSNLPTSFTSTRAKEYTDAGISPLWSFKADPVQVAAGIHDATLEGLAAAAPAGTGFCFWHEPENDVAAGSFTAAQWAAAFSRMHQRIKSVRGNQLWTAASHMTYQWGSGMSSTSNPNLWSVNGNADLICADTYHHEHESKITSVTQDDRHMRWHNWAKTQGEVGMTEFGIVSKDWSTLSAHTVYYTDQERATLLGNSLDWFRSQGYRMVLYWNAWHIGKSVGYRDDNLTPTASDGTAYPLALAAWNDRVAAYGSTKVWYGAP